MREIARWDYDVASLVIPDSDPELASAALAALLVAAGRGDSELKTAGFAGGHQAAMVSCGHSGTICEQTVW